jgi:hypothetical protein
MEKWFKLNDEEKLEIIKQTSNKVGLSPTAIEKDLWVMIALAAIFKTKYNEFLIFKGGTSLSKAWHLIERFSEDIDLGIDRKYFGFEGDLKRKEVTKLRKTSCKFVQEEFIPEFKKVLTKQKIDDFEINLTEFERSDTDPLAIELNYRSLTENIDYLKPRILIEISSRSLRNPFELKQMRSYIGQEYPGSKFSDKTIEVPTVLPTRTLLEKIFLLHEEFQKPKDKMIRSSRMTRHLYDINRIMDSEYLEKAINDSELYNTIVKHREMLTNISWVDYSKHSPDQIKFLPPKDVNPEWEKDYKEMQESMFYGATITYDELIEKLSKLQSRINND